MPEQKTKPTEKSVEQFLDTVTDEKKRDDSYALIKLMKKVTKAQPTMWGPSIIGFGSYHYIYATGHEGDAPLVGFSPRKAAISLYVTMPGLPGYDGLMKKLGKYKVSKACIYIKKLEDINPEILEKLMEKTVDYLKNKKWP